MSQPEMPSDDVIGGISNSKHRETIRVLLFLIPTVLLSGLIGAVTVLKTSFMLKEQLGINPSDLGTINLVLGIPSYLQPFIGMWTDMFAFFGYHRRSYYLTGKVLHIVSLLGLAFLEKSSQGSGQMASHELTVLFLMMLIAAGGIIRTVIFNAILVALGNFTGRFGQFLALVNLIPIGFSILYTSSLSGHVADHWSYSHAFTVGALITALSIPLVFLIDETRSGARRSANETEEEHRARMLKKLASRQHTLTAIRKAFRAPGLWALVAFVFYLIITPGVNNTKLYFQQDYLHFSRQFIGELGRFASLGALGGYFLYGAVSRRIPVYLLAWGAVLMDCVSYPALLLMRDHNSAIVLEISYSLIGAIYSVCLNTLAARLCPKGLEGVVYGLVMSAIAIASALSEKIGGTLYEYFGPNNHSHLYTVQHGWQWSCYFGLGFTLIAIVFIPFLPTWTRSHKRIAELTEAEVSGTE